MRRPLPIWTKLWIIGGVLVFLGAGIPLFIILKMIPSNLFLLAVAFISSMVGLFLGYYAMALYIRVHRPPRPPRDDYFHHDRD